MEGNKKSKLSLGILIGILATLVIGLTGFIVYDKIIIGSDNEPNDSTNSETPIVCSDCKDSIIISDISSLDNRILVDNKIMRVVSNEKCVGDGEISMCYYQILIDNTVVIDKFDEASVKSIHVINNDKIMFSLAKYDGTELFEFYNSNLKKVEVNDL